jgi:hypothetical protein
MFRSLLLAGALAASGPAAAQAFGALSQDNPSQIPDLAALGMGGAVAAAPTLDSPFFANPAHLTSSARIGFTLAGATAGFGGNMQETYEFVDNDLRPALDEGLDEIRANDPERLEALYAEALRVGAQQKTAQVGVLAPSFRARTGPVAFGVGAFGNAVVRARVTSGGAGIPFVDAYSQADVLVPGVVAARVPTPGLPFSLSVGASATYVQRRVTAKADPIDAFDTDAEKIYVLRGDAVRFGAGVYARDVLLPGFDLGADVRELGGAMAFDLDRSVAVAGSDSDPDDQAEIDALRTRFDARTNEPVYRIGAAYRVPIPQVPGLNVASVTVAADYTSASTSEFDQSVQAGLRAGVRASLFGALEVRGGVSQGYPSAGVSLKTRIARIDYAYYGVEDGRLLGQLGRQNHLVQIRFGLF